MTIQITTAGNTLDLDNIYKTLLNREPDAAGAKYWNEQFTSGLMSSDQIQKSIKAGKEYKNLNPISVANPFATDPNYTLNTSTASPANPDATPTYNRTVNLELDPAVTGYRGAAETGYTRTVPTFTGGYRKSSKNDRSAENLYQQNILDELTKYAQQSGLGNFAISDGSTPQWMPTDASRESIIDPHYRKVT